MRDLAKERGRKARSRSRSMCRAKAVGAEGREHAPRRGEKQAGEDAQDTANEHNICCSPKGCRHDNSKEVTDLASAVKVVCSFKTCKEGVFMHEDCFLAWEDDIIKNLQSHFRPQQLGRLQSWSVQQLRRDLWTRRVNDVTYKICICRCGGYLKKDEDWSAEKDAEKLRHDADDIADKKKKKKKKKGDKPGILWAKKSCHKFTDIASTKPFKKNAMKTRYLTESKIQVIPNPSQGAIGGHGSGEPSVKVTSDGTGKSNPERGRPETRSVTNNGTYIRSPSNNAATPSNKRASPDDTPISESHDDKDIPMPLALTAAYWWINFGWLTYLDYTLYANDKQSSADARTQGLVMCKSVNDVEKALGCCGLTAVSERMGEWWQEVGWDQFKSFMEHQ
ncbi:headcase protein-like [Branchiostoma lanceolatum]|uniref:headcase protein-like n=1 Tax=Branchiostoma lanceolatum TaxID=7740 RepID=UPI0034547B49